MEDYSKPRYMSQDAIAAEQQRFMVRVYNWMAAGLVTAGGVAYFVSTMAPIQRILFPVFGNPFTALLAWLGIFWFVNRFHNRIMNLPLNQATGTYFLIAGIFGLFISPLFVFYTPASITSTFLITAGTFGTMSFLGFVTKKDLSSLHSFLFMGFWGLVLAAVVNLFLGNSMLQLAISCFGVLIFVGLAATETQQIKEMNILGNEGTDEDTKEAVQGALILFITFINLFRFLMYFLGDRD